MNLCASALAVVLGVALFSLPTISTQREARAEVDIQASPGLVWAILTDFSAYPIWNPYIYPARGEARPGEHLEITLHRGRSSETFEATVLTAQPNRELSWSGRMIGFERIQTFTIQKVGPRRVRLISRELFRGFLVLTHGQVANDAQHGLEMMGRALRDVAEIRAASTPASEYRLRVVP